jgi:hypothetical protein
MPSGKLRNAGAALILLAASGPLAAQARTDPESRFRALYRDLVETDSSPTTGNCTSVAEKARAYLLEAGFPAGDVELVLAPDLPRDGNLVAHFPGTDPSAAPILLVAHIDVVRVRGAATGSAIRSSWSRRMAISTARGADRRQGDGGDLMSTRWPATRTEGFQARAARSSWR